MKFAVLPRATHYGTCHHDTTVVKQKRLKLRVRVAQIADCCQDGFSKAPSVEQAQQPREEPSVLDVRLQVLADEGRKPEGDEAGTPEPQTPSVKTM